MTNSTLQKQLIQAGAAFGGLAVIAGAFGSHGLKDVLEPVNMDIFETAVRYQFYHAFALLIIGFGMRRVKENVAKITFTSFIIGIILFCGSLYLLSTSRLWAGTKLRWFGAVAPVGGVSFVIGWAYLCFRGYKPSTHSHSAQQIQEMHKRKTDS
jgi:uncharacterized membrane protein YgdD (TMEM256/DUF423 family)